jgi:hypothetical protein
MRARRLSCVLRGSALRAEHLRMRSTAIVLAMPVHPSCGHYDRVLHHNESLRMIPKSGVRFSDQDHAPRKKEAKRRKAQAVHCPHRSSDWEGARQRSQRGPLAFRRSAAALAPASERQDSAQAALHAKHDAKALPPLRIVLKRGTSHPGRDAGGHSSLHWRKLRKLVCAARTARERGYKPRPHEPHSLRQLAVTGRRP